MCFAHPAHLWLLWLVLPLIAFAWFGVRRKLSAWRVLGGNGKGAGALAELSVSKLVVRRAMFVLSTALMLLAAAGPELCRGLRPERRKGLDVIYMLDVSNSMLARDGAPDRLSEAKSALLRISRKSTEGRKALLLLAGAPVVQCPLTGDEEQFELLLEMASPDQIEPQGTDYSRAFDAALRLADAGGGEAVRETVLVLASDGEDHGDGLGETAASMKRRGVRLHVIGVGSARPVPIPMPEGPKRDRQGRVVMSSFRPELLAGLVKTTGGRFWYSRPDGSVADSVAAAITAEAAAAGWVMSPASRLPVHRELIVGSLLLFVAASVTSDVRTLGSRKG